MVVFGFFLLLIFPALVTFLVLVKMLQSARRGDSVGTMSTLVLAPLGLCLFSFEIFVMTLDFTRTVITLIFIGNLFLGRFMFLGGVRQKATIPT